MITQLSEKYKLLVLLRFTKELINNSKTPELIDIEKKIKIVREIRKKNPPIRQIPLKNTRIPEQRRNIQKQNEQYFPTIQKDNFQQAPQNRETNFNLSQPRINIDQRTRPTGNQRLIIPEVNLPERFRYLKPVPTKEEIDLGKLNNFIRNPQIKEIECNGPDTEIIIKMPMPKKTDVVLTSAEIQEIFEAFSKAAKIPVEENIIKIAAGNLILNGINSKVIGSKFIIKRIGLGMRPV